MSSGAFMALICLTQVPDTVERGNSTSSQAEEALANFSDSGHSLLVYPWP